MPQNAALVTIKTAEGTKPNASKGFSKSSSVNTLRGNEVIRPKGSSLLVFVCIKVLMAESCSLTLKVSVRVEPSCNRTCMRVCVYSLGGDFTAAAGGLATAALTVTADVELTGEDSSFCLDSLQIFNI